MRWTARASILTHQHVNGQVEGDDNPRDGRLAVKLREAEESCGRVMVDMKELQGLLLEDEEDGV